MLVVPKGASRRKLLSNMKLKHGLQNSILPKLLVLELFHWLLPFFGLLPSLSCVPAATDNTKDLFEANQAVVFVCCFPVTFCPKAKAGSGADRPQASFAVVSGGAPMLNRSGLQKTESISTANPKQMLRTCTK